MEYNSIKSIINPYGVPREYFEQNFEAYAKANPTQTLKESLRKFEIEYRQGGAVKQVESRRNHRTVKTEDNVVSVDSK